MSKNNNLKSIPKELKRFIFFNSGRSLSVKNNKNGILINFGRFDSRDVACAAATLLIKHDWDVKEIVDDPVSYYLDEFYVFNVTNNILIFDSKFDSFEKAVEYTEINYRCNDFHNDIFRKSSKKKNKEPVLDEEIVDERYIFKRGNKFIVKKSKRNYLSQGEFCYGEFDSFDIARAARKLLLNFNWKVKDGREILFFDEVYWIFDIDYFVLTYLGKSNSYEDALDIALSSEFPKNDFENPFIKNVEDNFEKVMDDSASGTTESALDAASPSESPKNDFENPFIKNVEDNFERVMNNPIRRPSKPKKSKRKSKTSKKKNKRKLTYEDIVRENANIKFSVYSDKIWKPKVQPIEFNEKRKRVLVERKGDNVKDLSAILDFNFINNHIICIVNGHEIVWDNRNNVEIHNFPEFQLICDILEINKWDLNKISRASSIYYYRDAYYKVHIVDNKIVFGKFVSYASAENTFLSYKGRPIENLNYLELGIDKMGMYYEFVKFKNGGLYKIDHLKSLESIKAILDILVHSNWNLKIFDKYDLFYMNGFYWELKCRNNVIYLVERYELIKTI